MNCNILARVTGSGTEWTAFAYQAERVFCQADEFSENHARTELENLVAQRLTIDWRALLDRTRGTPATPNCPEAAVRLPIDSWYCKLFDEACPTQGQVLLNDPKTFAASCLAPPEQQKSIVDVISTGKYSGFHHIPGRYLFPACERQGGEKRSFFYHYPWELTSVEAYYPFEFESDWPEVQKKLFGSEMGITEISNALCAQHAMKLAALLDPLVASELLVLQIHLER